MSLAEVFPARIAAAREGDKGALNALFEAYYPAVERMAHRALRTDKQYAGTRLVALFSTGDVVQDVCWNVLRSLESFEGDSEGAFVTYLTTAVRTRLIDMLRFHMAVRRDWRRMEDSDDRPGKIVNGAQQPAEQLGIEEEVHAYFSVLASVPTRERTLLSRRLEHSDTFETLARELKYPSAEAARKAFYKAHARLLLDLRSIGIRPDGLNA